MTINRTIKYFPPQSLVGGTHARENTANATVCEEEHIAEDTTTRRYRYIVELGPRAY